MLMRNARVPMKWFLGALLLCMTWHIEAQVLQQRPVTPDAEFTLGVGDTLSVHVANLDDMPIAPMRIGPNGALDFPLIGQVQASGKTISELRAELASKLSKYINTPDITVNLVESASRPVSVVGEVVNPGVRQMVGPQHLLDAISMAGGLKPDAGPNVLVTRQPQWGKLQAGAVTEDEATHSSSTKLPLDSLLALKAPENNILMEPGDTVSVPRAELVYVVGDVKKPGGFELTAHNTMELLHAVSLAEGLVPNNAASHARILRPAPNGDGPVSEIPIDIPKILAGKDKDVPLFANDILYVPHSGFKAGSQRAIEAAIGLTTGILIYH